MNKDIVNDKSIMNDVIVKDGMAMQEAGMEVRARAQGVSTLRLSLVRGYYLLDFAMLGIYAWSTMFVRAGEWTQLDGVAFSFWAAISLLGGLGLRYPLAMLPLLFLQFLYKSTWLLAVALPMWLAGNAEPVRQMTGDMIFALVLLAAIMPWRYAFEQFVSKPAEPLRGRA